MRRTIVRTRLAADEVEALDAFAADRGLSRAATIRLLVTLGLGQVGPAGSLTPFPPADEGAWPTSDEVRLELVRRRLWDMSQAGSATAAVALEKALARDRVVKPSGGAERSEPDDPFAEVDELRRRREMGG